ncbi:MAG: FAD-dependent oxidoreductase, partial [Myxococcales bacterium]
VKLPALRRDISAFTSTNFDLCVVGGGITGLCIAHDAAARGLKVALLERGDFAQGTTTASTKLIHGGTRYLEHYEFGLVREALHERRLLLKLAPHLVNPLPFMIPIYRDGPIPPWKIRAGMLLYDMLSFDKNWGTLPDKHMPWHHYVSPRKALELEPGLRQPNLIGASIYYDGQVPSPARLCLEIAKTAALNGAVLANYAPVKAMRVENGRVAGVEAEDLLTGHSFAVNASITINAAGIWATDVMKLLGPKPVVELRPSKGIHVMTRPITRSHAVVSATESGRRVMMIPWRGKSLIGTTDVFYDGDKDRIRPTVDEVNGLLDEINSFLPSAALTLDDVDRAYAGARPLIYEPGKSSSDLSRKHQVIDHGKANGLPGLLSVVGGKLTTSRALAKEVTSIALGFINKHERCRTQALTIGGGDIGVVDAFVAQQKSVADAAVDEQVLRELVHSYGTGYVDVLQYVFLGPLVGALMRPVGGWLSDRLGGAPVTFWNFVT